MKLEQIRSSVNFPFHSFQGTNEQSKPVIEVQDMAVEICDPQGSVAMPAPSSKIDKIILLNDDSKAEDSIGGNSEGTNDQKNNFGMSALELDNRDEAMSLSELSSSFEKCFESINHNEKGRQVEKSQESGFLQVKPFDYEAARKEVRFGEDPGKRSASGSDNKGSKRLVNSGNKKKGSVIGAVVQRDDGTTELLPQGRRRQAFPATGNRSSTFR
jgi:exosome complex exonuclease RRP6